MTIGTEGSCWATSTRASSPSTAVEGDLHGSESVIVNETGQVTGNIFAPRVGIVEGALFNGRVEMGARRGIARHDRRQCRRSRAYCSLSSRPSAYSVRSSSDPAGARRKRRAPTRG